MDRKRIYYLLFLFVTLVAGFSARKFSCYLPAMVNIYLGDALWALMIYFGFAFLFRNFFIWKIALFSLLFCFFIEITQVYQAPWINAIRHTKLGGLVLGFGFLWTDIVAYTLGVIAGVIVELLILKYKKDS
jgi:hypothetical protein